MKDISKKKGRKDGIKDINSVEVRENGISIHAVAPVPNRLLLLTRARMLEGLHVL
jgi:hypothetical protein